MKTVMVLAGLFLLVFSESLFACYESDFDGEELLVLLFLEVTLATIKWEGLFLQKKISKC